MIALTNGPDILLTIAAVTAALIVPANAGEYPFRDPGPARTAFVEAATRTCIQHNVLPDRLKGTVTISQFCDCFVDVGATMVTASDTVEMIQGGFHDTPATLALERDAKNLCMIVLRNGAPSK